jgi:hypothetical protein
VSGAAGRGKPPSRNWSAVWLWAEAPDAGPAGPWTGKWAPRTAARDVDETWAKVAAATRAGRLGPCAKVSTALNNEVNTRGAGPGTHVICVYTADCRDLADLARVCAELRRLGFAGRLVYKENGATYAGLYGSGASLYVAQPGACTPQRRRAPVPATPEQLAGRDLP